MVTGVEPALASRVSSGITSACAPVGRGQGRCGPERGIHSWGGVHRRTPGLAMASPSAPSWDVRGERHKSQTALTHRDLPARCPRHPAQCLAQGRRPGQGGHWDLSPGYCPESPQGPGCGRCTWLSPVSGRHGHHPSLRPLQTRDPERGRRWACRGQRSPRGPPHALTASAPVGVSPAPPMPHTGGSSGLMCSCCSHDGG